MMTTTDRLSASQRITDEVCSWPGVEAGPGRRGEFAFKVGQREIGHLHGDHAAHFSFPKSVWVQLHEEGRIAEHPVFPAGRGRCAAHRERERHRGRGRAAAAQLRPRDRVSVVRTSEVTRFGGPEVLELRERPDPVAGPEQVVVDVAAIPLLWLDTALRSGKGRDWFPISPPYVPGNGVAGTVSSTGPAVEPGWIGRPVVTDTRQTGSYAERVAVAADGLVPIPDELTTLTAAALLTDGRTALRILDGISIEAGTPVLITGAAGGMGLLLVQLATAHGARVIGAARGEPKLTAVRAQGAHAAIDYSDLDWTGRVLAALDGDRPTLVLDGVGGEIGQAAFGITANGGLFSAHGSASGAFAPLDENAARERAITIRRITDVQFTPEDAARRLRDALAQAAAGRIAPVIGQTYPLQNAAEAHRHIEAREAIGKSLLLANQEHA